MPGPQDQKSRAGVAPASTEVLQYFGSVPHCFIRTPPGMTWACTWGVSHFLRTCRSRWGRTCDCALLLQHSAPSSGLEPAWRLGSAVLASAHRQRRLRPHLFMASEQGADEVPSDDHDWGSPAQPETSNDDHHWSCW